MVMIYKRLWVGGCAEWPFTVCKKQSFTYALDCGKAIAMLALANDCYNQVCQCLLSLTPFDVLSVSLYPSEASLNSYQRS